MAIVNMHDAKTTLSRLVARAQAGEDIVIARNRKPVARLTAISGAGQRRPLGGMEGQIWTSDDFDEEVPEIQEMFYRAEDQET
ncbi:MAG: type II toxin-antitoxin system Phd/YefM family antitoxin [Chloroflexota bacterium]